MSVLEGQRVVRRFREIEIELVDGDEQDLQGLVKDMRRSGAVEEEVLRPELHRALDIPAPHAPLVVDPGSAPGAALGVALGEEVEALLAHDPGARRGDDPEDVHQLRVATRRLRAFLRAAGVLVDRDWAVSLREELGWLGGHLGPARDLDVMLDRLRSEVAGLDDDGASAAGLLAALEDERAAAYRDVAETLGGARYYALVVRLEAATTPPLSGDDTPLKSVFHKGGQADAPHLYRAG